MLTNTATARQLRQRKQQLRRDENDFDSEDDTGDSRHNADGTDRGPVPSYDMAVRGYTTSLLHSPGRNRCYIISHLSNYSPCLWLRTYRYRSIVLCEAILLVRLDAVLPSPVATPAAEHAEYAKEEVAWQQLFVQVEDKTLRLLALPTTAPLLALTPEAGARDLTETATATATATDTPLHVAIPPVGGGMIATSGSGSTGASSGASDTSTSTSSASSASSMLPSLVEVACIPLRGMVVLPMRRAALPQCTPEQEQEQEHEQGKEQGTNHNPKNNKASGTVAGGIQIIGAMPAPAPAPAPATASARVADDVIGAGATGAVTGTGTSTGIESSLGIVLSLCVLPDQVKRPSVRLSVVYELLC